MEYLIWQLSQMIYQVNSAKENMDINYGGKIRMAHLAEKYGVLIEEALRSLSQPLMLRQITGRFY